MNGNDTPQTAGPGTALTAPVAANSNAALAALLPAIEQRVELIKRIHRVIDRQVTPDCYEVMDGQVCRNINYARLIHRLVGGTFSFLKDDHGKPLIIKTNYDDAAGPYYVYEAFGRYELPNGEVMEASGMFSSRDKFLGRAGGEFKDQQDVDERSVREAAQTECFKKCIFAALGYPKHSTEADLKAAGVDTARAASFQHGAAGSRGGSTDGKDEAQQRSEVRQMCVDLLNANWQKQGQPPPQTPEEVLQQITHSEKFGGWRSFEKISKAGLKYTHQDVERAHKATLGAQGANGGASESAASNGFTGGGAGRGAGGTGGRREDPEVEDRLL